jgi:hypothetical protein
MPRCTLSTTASACLRRSGRRFKRWNDQLRAKNVLNRGNYRTKTNNSTTKHDNPRPRSTDTCLGCSTGTQAQSTGPRGRKRRAARRSRLPKRGTMAFQDSVSEEPSDCICSASGFESPSVTWNPGKSWDERRRDSRVNGANIYVARVTKGGLGNAKPCWRCLEWCRWAGVKRVFHWNGEENRFDAVKVNGAERENYETRADTRLFAGLVSPECTRCMLFTDVIVF